jgi:hypothetical protein
VVTTRPCPAAPAYATGTWSACWRRPAPRRDPERTDGAGVNGDTGPADDPSLDDATAAVANLFRSSFGFTCVVAADTDALTVTAIWEGT